jgi:predicted dehydrogenase/threonine dehydrogenase-like Zn-dependent dehydrogenase
VIVEDVPAPRIEPGCVLVAVKNSCISSGTELSGIRAGARPLWKRILGEPENVRRIITMALNEGIGKTRGRIGHALSAGRPTGYSLAGTVIEAGEGVQGFQPGDRVACAGSQYAFHAEIVRVPGNLTVTLPDGLEWEEASTVTLGAIALQGVRRLNPTLGECFVVIGLGILGQITAQLLKANGCRIIGVDLDNDRVNLARSLGMDMGLEPEAGNQVDSVFRITGGAGADGVMVTAATSSSEILSTAFKMCRKKGRVVLVGDVGLDIRREDIYAKELDFLISTSYGPGRYDQRYEEHGLDYPLSYVRWTENRNMEEYLRLVSEGRLSIRPLISATYPVEDAAAAYSDLQKPGAKPLIALLSYPQAPAAVTRKVAAREKNRNPQPGKIRIAVVGAGGFAVGTHLPHLKKLSVLYEIRAICSRTGHQAQGIAKEYDAAYATTEFEQVLADPDVDAILIATRHHLHAPMALQALMAGKHVLVEKPLAMNQNELEKIKAFFAEKKDAPILLTGFNRRFSPHLRRIHEITERRTNPIVINYRMNAGYIPLDHWVHGPEGGGRNIGEACHIYDLFTFLTRARSVRVQGQALRPQTGYYDAHDNFVCTVSFEDGSLATLTYTALGSKEYPKEEMELYADGRVIVMKDFLSVEIFGSKEKGIKTKVMDKGLEEELRSFALAIQEGGSWPNPLWQQVQAMEIALKAESELAK